MLVPVAYLTFQKLFTFNSAKKQADDKTKSIMRKPLFLSLCITDFLSLCLSDFLSVHLSICLSLFLSVSLSVFLSICLSLYMSVYVSVSVSVSLSVYLSVDLSGVLSLHISHYIFYQSICPTPVAGDPSNLVLVPACSSTYATAACP